MVTSGGVGSWVGDSKSAPSTEGTRLRSFAAKGYFIKDRDKNLIFTLDKTCRVSYFFVGYGV